MLSLLIILGSLFSAGSAQSDKSIDCSKIHHFYLYTKEEIEDVAYGSRPSIKTKYQIRPSVEKVSLLSYANIKISKDFIPDFMIDNIYKISYQMISGVSTKVCLIDPDKNPVLQVEINGSVSNDGTKSKDMKF